MGNGFGDLYINKCQKYNWNIENVDTITMVCASQLIITTRALANILNSHGQTDMAILDFSKVFDKAHQARHSHTLLAIMVLEALQINGKMFSKKLITEVYG